MLLTTISRAGCERSASCNWSPLLLCLLQVRLLEAYTAAGHITSATRALMGRLKEKALADVSGCSLELLSMLVCACGRLGDHDTPFFMAVADHVAQLHPQAFTVRTMVCLADGFSHSQIHHWPLYEALVNAADEAVWGDGKRASAADLQRGRELFGRLGSEEAVEAAGGDERLRQLLRVARKCANRLAKEAQLGSGRGGSGPGRERGKFAARLF